MGTPGVVHDKGFIPARALLSSQTLFLQSLSGIWLARERELQHLLRTKQMNEFNNEDVWAYSFEVPCTFVGADFPAFLGKVEKPCDGVVGRE